MQFLVVAKNMESLLDFSVSPLIFVIRGAYYSLLNVFLGGERVMSLVDILVTFVFGVCLPTLDTYSDLGLAYTLIRPTCRKYKGYIYHEKYLGWSSKFLHQGKYKFQYFQKSNSTYLKQNEIGKIEKILIFIFTVGQKVEKSPK